MTLRNTRRCRLQASFAAALALPRPSDLDQEKVRTRILKLTDGVTVRVARLLERLAIEAIRREIECITLECFESTSHPCLIIVDGRTSCRIGIMRLQRRPTSDPRCQWRLPQRMMSCSLPG